MNVPHAFPSGEDRVGRGAAVRRHHVVLQLAYRLDACGSHRRDRDAVAHRIEPRFVAGDQEIPRLGLTLRETPGHGKRASDVRPIGPSRATDVDSDELSGSSDPIALVVAEKGPGQSPHVRVRAGHRPRPERGALSADIQTRRDHRGLRFALANTRSESFRHREQADDRHACVSFEDNHLRVGLHGFHLHDLRLGAFDPGRREGCRDRRSPECPIAGDGREVVRCAGCLGPPRAVEIDDRPGLDAAFEPIDEVRPRTRGIERVSRCRHRAGLRNESLDGHPERLGCGREEEM